jgi:tetratricopeptide (TPR) repeat protein
VSDLGKYLILDRDWSVAVRAVENLSFFLPKWANSEYCFLCMVSMLKHKLSIAVITAGICSFIVIGGMTAIAQALNQNPDLAFAYSIRGNVLAEIFDDRQRAIESYTRSIQLQPKRAITYYFRAKTRYKAGDKQGAIDDFSQAIKIDPNCVRAYSSRGVVKSNSGNTKEAIEDYNRAIAIQPNYANAYYGRGVARLKLSDRQGAIEDLDRAAKLFQTQGKTKDARAALDLIEKRGTF